jgi:hypothetical protein
MHCATHQPLRFLEVDRRRAALRIATAALPSSHGEYGARRRISAILSRRPDAMRVVFLARDLAEEGG